MKEKGGEKKKKANRSISLRPKKEAKNGEDAFALDESRAWMKAALLGQVVGQKKNRTHQCVIGPRSDVVPVEVLILVPDRGVEHRRRGKEQREEPDERDEDGVWPRPGHDALLPGKVPLAVLYEEVPREEEQGQGEEEEEGVVEEAVAGAVDVAEGPGQADDLRVKGEGDAKGSDQDVPGKNEKVKVRKHITKKIC